jgi:hypothetical protein
VNTLPTNRTELEKAIRTLEKGEDIFVEFVYRMSEEYLNKLQPNFDTLSVLVDILFKKGSGEQAKNVISAIQKQRGFKLLWKSYTLQEK